LKHKEWHKEAIELRGKGLSSRQIGKRLGLGKSTINNYFSWLYNFAEATKFSVETPTIKMPKILLLDLESAPSKAYIWKRWKENIPQARVISEGYLLTYSAKWLGSDTIISNRIVKEEDDYNIVKDLWDLYNQADIVVAHNLNRFDQPLAFARMIYHGFTPPSPTKSVDTLLTAKKNFKFPSNALDSLASYLGIDERKIQHSGFDLWVRCMNMEQEAFEEMLEYNAQDVVVLEKVYLKLRAWDKLAPNLALYYNDVSEVKRCVCCGSDNLELTKYRASTSLSLFDTYQCGNCGKYNRSRSNLRTKDEMKNTLSNVI
jgi:transposase-like protein